MKCSKGSATIEMAYIGPMALVVILIIIHIVFFFYDKNIVTGATAETAVIGALLERREDLKEEASLTEIFDERVNGKLVMYGEYQVNTNITEDQVTIEVSASKGPLSFNVTGRAEIMLTEKVIRRHNNIEEFLENGQ